MKKLFRTSFLLILLTLSACKSTRIVSSWREPNKQITLSQLKKVLVVARFKTETDNRLVEDKMVEFLGTKAIASYDYLKASFNKENIEILRTKIKNDNFDGALTMRLIDVETEQISKQGNFDRYPNNYRDFNNYFYDSQMSYNNPEYSVTTKIYTIETNLYSIKENKIIWTALTETNDPKSVQIMTEEVTKPSLTIWL